MTTSTTTTTYVAEPERRLPIGVAIIAVLIALFGIVLLLVGILLLIFGAAGLFAGLAFFGAGLVGGIILIILSLIVLAIASGLWNLELWALVLSIIVVGALWILDVLSGNLFSLGSLILFVLLVYLIAVHRNFL
jgi:hypothetical protein